MPSYGALNFIGSSGYGTNANGRYGPLISSPTQPAEPTDYPVMDPASGKLVSLHTGKPWSGKDPWSGKTYSMGSAVADPNANKPPDLQAKEIVKDPATATAQQGLMKTFQDSAASSLQDFSKYLAQFKTDLSSARTKAAAATDAQPTINALTQANTQYSGALDSSNQAYQKALADAAANERGVVKQATDTLPMYDAAANAIADRQTQEAVRQVSRYKMGTGTPTSLGSAEQQILGRSVADARLPLEQAKIGQRYNILNNLAMPTEQSIGAQNISYSGNYLPGVAGSRYGAATSTANSIQGLKAQVAQMSYADALKFLQASGVPPQIQQQILSGQISQLGGLNQIADASHYRYVQDPNAMTLSQPMYPNSGVAPYPNQNPGGGGRYQQPQNGQPGNGVPLAGNAPVTVGPGGVTQSRNYSDYAGRGMDVPSNNYPGMNYAGDPRSPGSQANAYFDPVSGQILDRTTGQPVGPQPYPPDPSQFIGDATPYAGFSV